MTSYKKVWNLNKMLRILMLISFLFVTFNSFAQDSVKPIIAAQIFYSEATNIEEFEREIEVMKSLGVNVVIFRVFGNKGDRIYTFAKPKSEIGVYFNTSHSPVIDDILGQVTKIAHKHKLKIFAWMTTRHATYGVEGDVMDNAYSFSKKDYIAVPKLDLFNDVAVWELQQLYLDLAKYPIDGILIQDDFVMRHMECFGTEARVQYLSEFSKDVEAKNMFSELELKPDGSVKRIVYTEEFWQFQEWKNKRLILVADELISTVRETNPNIKFALNVGYELFYKPKNALAWYAHDDRLARKFDYVAVMAYQDQIMKELDIGLDEVCELSIETAEDAISIMGGPEKVIMKVQTLNWDTKKDLPMREVRYVYKKVQSVSPKLGIALVPWEKRKFDFLNVKNKN